MTGEQASIAQFTPAEKRALLARLVKERARRARAYPLSFAQERLWFFERLQPGTPVYNVPFAMTWRGEIDAGTMRRSLNEMVRRHEVLRTTFSEQDGRPVQLVSPRLEL